MNTLKAFNQCVLHLGRLARESGASRFIGQGLQTFSDLVPFTSAWWGEMSTPAADVPHQSWMHGSLNLPESFAAEWHPVAADDQFSHATLKQPGQVLRDKGFNDPSEAVNAFARRYDLYHLMSITYELPESGLMFFVCLYRGEREQSFSESEGELYAAYCDHLFQLWRFQVQDMIRFDSDNGASDAGVARLDGSLLYVGARLCAAIQRELPGWSGSTLPPDVVAQLPKAPCVIRLGRCALTLSPNGEHVILSLEAPSGSQGLAPRERTAAMLFAAGHSYKEIARMLALSPATVRTYLRNCYVQLGVKSKVELGSALRSATVLADAARRD
ncbi:helix-turn-helix transcriptional regulator [Pseudomonas vancouverensis]|uniref:Helix-turn-helix transcriptional regulator n=1 Tax=Pseudomonas vancouverensis TaxID=95300 RepID=A0A4R4KBR5_PSEVA|nr:LuxR C-terminal-related transcriptional regulator [Pseudomonas vancouverensis]KAB0496756.1 helix-turn-helix transcriptional regulator [Pseudomonas vancouverensis]TDB65043.1 helix-turn-helix transcriptional regulator [Pseudomonas vancouverensis]